MKVHEIDQKYRVMSEYIACPLCNGHESEHCQILEVSQGDYLTFDCYVCGRFRVSQTVLDDSQNIHGFDLDSAWRAKLSHDFRLFMDASDGNPTELPLITSQTIESCKGADPILPSTIQMVDSLIRLVGDQFLAVGSSHLTDGATRTRIGALNQSQMNAIEKIGVDSGKFNFTKAGRTLNSRGGIIARKALELTLLGWEGYYESLRRPISPGNYAFVAMKFGDKILDDLINDTVKPTVKKETGYDVIDLRDVSQAGVIDNLMRQCLSEAAFVLVDLTHDNFGAYWEGGFAEGLGKPVIYLCEEKKFNEQKTHFDTNHCTTVVWSSSDLPRFKSELIATIKRSLSLY